MIEFDREGESEFALKSALPEKYPNTDLFLVHIFPHSHCIREIHRISPNSVRMQENTD